LIYYKNKDELLDDDQVVDV